MNNYLTHWGILGMERGKRRFQNLDGSLTPAGRERYLKGGGQPDRKGNVKLTRKGRARQADAIRSAKSLIGEAANNNGEYSYRTSKQNEEILSVAADKAVKTLNRIQYLEETTSSPTAKISVKQRYAMTRDLEKAQANYKKMIKDVTKAIVAENKTTRLQDFQNGDYSEYEKQVATMLHAIGNRRADVAKRLGL